MQTRKDQSPRAYRPLSSSMGRASEHLSMSLCIEFVAETGISSEHFQIRKGVSQPRKCSDSDTQEAICSIMFSYECRNKCSGYFHQPLLPSTRAGCNRGWPVRASNQHKFGSLATRCSLTIIPTRWYHAIVTNHMTQRMGVVGTPCLREPAVGGKPVAAKCRTRPGATRLNTVGRGGRHR